MHIITTYAVIRHLGLGVINNNNNYIRKCFKSLISQPVGIIEKNILSVILLIDCNICNFNEYISIIMWSLSQGY